MIRPRHREVCTLMAGVLMTLVAAAEDADTPAPLDRPVVLHVSQATVGEILDEVITQTGVSVMTSAPVRQIGPLWVHLDGVRARDVLASLEELTSGISVTIREDRLVVLADHGVTPLPPQTEPPPEETPAADAEPDFAPIKPVTLADLYFRSGVQLREEGHEEEANASFQRALRLDPAHKGARLALDSRPEEPAPRQILAPLSFADIYYETGLEHRKEGDTDAARSCFRRALELDPDHEGARQALSQE